MIKTRTLLILLVVLLLAACSPQGAPTQAPATDLTSVTEPDPTTGSPSTEVAVTECPGSEINPIGESIAADYAFTSYEQVMTWFCEGAEFEDILVALETEALTDEPAGDMLQMLADGLTWEDVWVLIGIDE